MIPIEKLKQVRKVIAHGGKCPDGRASAMIVNDAFRASGMDVPIEFVVHNTKEHEAIVPEPGLLFVDFNIPLPRREEGEAEGAYRTRVWNATTPFLEAGTLVLDHHRGPKLEDGSFLNKNIVKRFESLGLGVFADEEEDPSVSGAELAYRHVWKPFSYDQGKTPHAGTVKTIARFAHLAGVRDTWQKQDAHWVQSCEQGEALRFWPEDHLLNLPISKWDEMVSLVGPMLWKKKVWLANKIAEEAYRWTSAKGTKVAMFQGTKLSSDVAESLDTKVDFVIGFDLVYEDGKHKMAWSTRSHTAFNCANLCSKHGGGGHTRAAGFAYVMDIEKDPNPYKIARDLLDEYEASCE